VVKPGGNEVIAVEIFKEKNDVMKVITAKKPWSIRDYYINSVLMKTIERGTSSSSHTLRRCQG
jgi:nitrate reductase alpha subunit